MTIKQSLCNREQSIGVYYYYVYYFIISEFISFNTRNTNYSNQIYIQYFTNALHWGSLRYSAPPLFHWLPPTVLMIYDRNFLELVQWQERSWLVYINPSDLCSHVLNYRLMETCCGVLLPIEIRSPPQPGVILIHIQHPGSRSISIDLQ